MATNYKHNETGHIIGHLCLAQLPVVVRYRYEQTQQPATHTVGFDHNDNWLLPRAARSNKKEREGKRERT